MIIRTIQPPVRGLIGLVERVAAMEDDSTEDTRGREWTSAGEYLNYWHRRIVNELTRTFGHVKTPGFPTARPQYVWGVIWSAYLARALGIPRISVMEFGVAGGNGLTILEAIAELVKNYFKIEIDVYGFDTGQGYPKPVDYRDTPNLFRESEYPMDAEKLRARLKSAELLLGPVEETVSTFVHLRPAPVAFCAFDMSLYSSTSKALKLFEAGEDILLPRIQCYFGSSMGHTYSEFNGDRLAISEFNASHEMRKISPCFGLEATVPNSQSWAGRMFLAHIFDHTLYGADDGLIKVRDNPLVV